MSPNCYGVAMIEKFVSNRDESVRVFKNPVLEYFSHIHPLTPLVVFAPVVLWMVVRSVLAVSIVSTALFFVLGAIGWTLIEYLLHRFVFHYEPKTDLGKRVHFLVHGVHHDYPRDSTRLVMPLLVSVPLSFVFYWLFNIMSSPFHNAVFAGFVFAYVAYDMIHYYTHHVQVKSRIGRFLKEYHMKHHYSDENSAFGVSSPIWDYVFNTVPEWVSRRRKRTA